jgi:hypothetical protein
MWEICFMIDVKPWFYIAFDKVMTDGPSRGKMDAEQNVTARIIEENQEGTLVFGDSVDLMVRFAPRINDAGENFIRMEVRTKESTYRKHSIVVAGLDYCVKLVEHGNFKPPNKRGKNNPSAKEDGFETGSYLTYGLVVPKGFLDGNTKHFRFRGWVFGLCRDYKEYWNKLAKSKEIEKLAKMTMDKTLRFWPTGTKYKPLESNEPKECIHLLYEIAIPQSLAGPADDDAWKGRPVADLVELIYKKHVHNWVRVHRKEANKHTEYKPEVNPDNQGHIRHLPPI